MTDKDLSMGVQEDQIDQPVDIDQGGIDSVAEDINKFKSSLEKLKRGFNKKAKPVADQVKKKVKEKAPVSVKEKIFKRLNLRWLKFLFVPLFIIFIGVIIYSLVRSSMENGSGESSQEPTGIETPTPTLEPIGTVRQSIYTQDAEIKELQEQLNVVNNEMFSVPLRDSTLNPPVLDFNIEFE